MNAKPTTINIAISREIHEFLVSYIQSIDGKIGKFTEKAIKQKIYRDAKLKTFHDSQ
jgi:hypothetical protein